MPPDLPDASMDAHRIAQVITNLLSNAIKFSPPGDQIEVATTREAGAIRIAVRDHGAGIAAVDRKSVV